MTPARQAALEAHKRRMRAAYFDRAVFCECCRKWVSRDLTHMAPTRRGRGRIECKHHREERHK